MKPSKKPSGRALAAAKRLAQHKRFGGKYYNADSDQFMQYFDDRNTVAREFVRLFCVPAKGKGKP